MTLTDDELKRLAERAKRLAPGIRERENRDADVADYLAAFKHELYGTDNKLGRRKEKR